ncbi:MAG TPA: zinc ribbon domain-containing protein [Candidatus Doudnabacteria bacterium]|nr:zinc ribbon domain-containing protein [Candidatus Doudnabacteria bacterium]
MFCKQCGHQLQANDQICNKCGTSVQNVVPESAAAPAAQGAPVAANAPVAPVAMLGVNSAATALPGFKVLFNTAWENYKLKFKDLIILQLLILIPIFVAIGIGFGLVVSGIFENNQVVMIIAIALAACVVIGLIYLAIWLQAAMIHLLVSNTPTTWRESLTQVKSRLLSFFGASLLSGLIILVGFILIIPGLILMVLLAFSSYIAVAEGSGAVESVKKSREYARNYFWPLAGRFVLFGLVYFVFFIVIGIIDGMFDSTVLGNIASFFIAPLASAYLIAVYMAIKQIKGTIAVS